MPPTGPIRFSPAKPDLSAKPLKNHQCGKSAGLYFTSESNNISPPVIHRIPVTSFVQRDGSAVSMRFL